MFLSLLIKVNKKIMKSYVHVKASILSQNYKHSALVLVYIPRLH